MGGVGVGARGISDPFYCVVVSNGSNLGEWSPLGSAGCSVRLSPDFEMLYVAVSIRTI